MYYMDMKDVVVSVRIDEDLKRRMERLRHINWSEVIRRAIKEVVEAEEARLMRKRDVARLMRAVEISNGLYRRIPGWSSTEEIRRWRERR